MMRLVEDVNNKRSKKKKTKTKNSITLTSIISIRSRFCKASKSRFVSAGNEIEFRRNLPLPEFDFCVINVKLTALSGDPDIVVEDSDLKV